MQARFADDGVARALPSTYLIAYALAQPQPNWIEIATIPALWAAVIAAPIIAHHALGNRDVTAAALLVAASAVGSAWTLSGTIGRQSEGADERVAASVQIERQRRDLSQKLVEAVEILGKYRRVQATECASGLGKRCDGLTYTVQTWSAAIDGYEAKLKALPPPRRHCQSEYFGERWRSARRLTRQRVFRAGRAERALAQPDKMRRVGQLAFCITRPGKPQSLLLLPAMAHSLSGLRGWVLAPFLRSSGRLRRWPVVSRPRHRPSRWPLPGIRGRSLCRVSGNHRLMTMRPIGQACP